MDEVQTNIGDPKEIEEELGNIYIYEVEEQYDTKSYLYSGKTDELIPGTQDKRGRSPGKEKQKKKTKLEIRLESGETITVPRELVELIQDSTHEQIRTIFSHPNSIDRYTELDTYVERHQINESTIQEIIDATLEERDFLENDEHIVNLSRRVAEEEAEKKINRRFSDQDFIETETKILQATKTNLNIRENTIGDLSSSVDNLITAQEKQIANKNKLRDFESIVVFLFGLAIMMIGFSSLFLTDSVFRILFFGFGLLIGLLFIASGIVGDSYIND